MHPRILIAKLQWPGWEGEASADRASHRLGVGDDCFEIFHADGDVHFLLHMEVFEVLGVDSDGCLEGLFEYLYFQVSWLNCLVALFPVRTFTVLDLLGEACEDCLAILRQEVQLFSLWAKVLDILSQHSGRYFPSLCSSCSVKQCMHHLHRFIGEFVCFRHACKCELAASR